MEEVWKDIQGYEGLYQVSSLGRVRSLDRYVPHKTFGRKFCKGRTMITHINNAGYVTVNLCKGNKCTSFDVHRLVATAFLYAENPNAVQVNHKDENKHNNRIDNLEWCSRSYNNTYGTKVARQKVQIEKAVLQYDVGGNFVKEFPSATAAEKEISGKFTGAISHCLSGKTKTAYGFMWRFKEVT